MPSPVFVLFVCPYATPTVMRMLAKVRCSPVEMASSRSSQLWKLDANADIRFSHENPDIQTLYRAYLKKPLGEKAHHLLHTDHNAWDAMPEKP